ncbi:MAG: hypothetical protein E6J91_06485 [Deltaproteobacteria bacterium]|nr:MAG: hypothetical protein E6J91_06485 [Deltaproteobacteria bacterium]
MSATSCAATEPANVWISSLGSNVQPHGPASVTVAGPAHATATSGGLSDTVPLPPLATRQVWPAGLVATATVYDAPSATGCANSNAPLPATLSSVSTPSARSRSVTPSAPFHRPCTRPVIRCASLTSAGRGKPHAETTSQPASRTRI